MQGLRSARSRLWRKRVDRDRIGAALEALPQGRAREIDRAFEPVLGIELVAEQTRAGDTDVHVEDRPAIAGGPRLSDPLVEPAALGVPGRITSGHERFA